MKVEKKAKKKDKKNFASKTFSHSPESQVSIEKMAPLLKFLGTYPTIEITNNLKLSNKNVKRFQNNVYKFLTPRLRLTHLSALKMQNEDNFSSFQSETDKAYYRLNASKRWSVNQYLTIQGRDTDLFMDIHPTKSFSNVISLKTYLSAQETLGSLVCDIYSGLFVRRVSKNILVTGAPGNAKSFFIQALAGETELKIVTDNSSRYAVIQGGIPIGMKLLRDVFNSIALHTPCLFLLEDIHLIGERRPMLMSDDDVSKSNDTMFGAEQEEVHEKNRSIYESSRHSISNYRKPYKGDFSLSIPTTHFCYDLFLGVSPSRKRKSGLTTKSPLPVFQLDKALFSKESMVGKDLSTESRQTLNNNLLSVLQISTEQIFAPPATSPFNILLMKEQKKLRPKKIVKELPWSGISYDRSVLLSKSHYSVRAKVASLAEMALNNFSVKLDMITDLLVIIDSVRSNRGFVVFATTHLPSQLDPALRRPGRFDETIPLPFLPNLTTRFQVLKTSLASFLGPFDIFDASLLTSALKQNETQISARISNSLLLLLNVKGSKVWSVRQCFNESAYFARENLFKDYPIVDVSQGLLSSLKINESISNPKKTRRLITKMTNISSFDSLVYQPLHNSTKNQSINPSFQGESIRSFLKPFGKHPSLSGHDRFDLISLIYGQAGQVLVDSLILKDKKTYSRKFFQERFDPNSCHSENEMFGILYDSKQQSNFTLLKLLASKFSEFFAIDANLFLSLNRIFTDSESSKSFDFSSKEQKLIGFEPSQKTESQQSYVRPSFRLLAGTERGWFDKNFSKEETRFFSRKKDWWLKNASLLETNPSQSSGFENVQDFRNYWQEANSFLDSLCQKRYLNNKNSIVSKLLFFEDETPLRDPSSPPNSSLLMPARNFENYKRTLKDFVKKPLLTINEKLQLHQKQRFLKLLYNIPLRTNFSKTLRKTRFPDDLTHPTADLWSEGRQAENQRQSTSFYDSFKELSYIDSMTSKFSSSFCFYKTRFLTRQRFSLVNQWWNGQLAEHNVEMTYLSHVDWRSKFISEMGDVSIDFPDAEQYYNPKSRRWFVHSKSWAYWLSFESPSQKELSKHYVFSCFTEISNLLNSHRELFDYLAFRFLRYHKLQEIDILTVLVRFHKMKTTLKS